MSETGKEQYENILILKNIVEADLMGKLLTEEALPHYIRPWQDVNFDGVFVDQKGFGWLMGRKVDEEHIKEIYSDLSV